MVRSTFCNLVTARWRGGRVWPLASWASWSWALPCQQLCERDHLQTLRCQHCHCAVTCWWHGFISHVGTQSCPRVCHQKLALPEARIAEGSLRRGQWVLEQGEAGGGLKCVVETEKKNGILQQGGSGVVDLPHHSSQWPTHLFWHKYLLWSYVEAWRQHVPSHLWSSGFVTALWRVSLMF